MHEFAEAIVKMTPEQRLAAIILILFAVPVLTALTIWILEKIERAMRSMAGDIEQTVVLTQAQHVEPGDVIKICHLRSGLKQKSEVQSVRGSIIRLRPLRWWHFFRRVEMVAVYIVVVVGTLVACAVLWL